MHLASSRTGQFLREEKMSLLASISNAVSGMTAQSFCFANISDNLANSSTSGYKCVGTQFVDLVTSGGSKKNGAGTLSSPVYYNSKQGAISSVSTATFMAVSGNGFFTVAPSDGTTIDTADVHYTRSGDFTLDADGCMTNGAGYYLLGWSVDPETIAVNQGALVPVEVSAFLEPAVATTGAVYTANLPANFDVGYTSSGASTTIYSSISDLIDPLSTDRGHEMTCTWLKTGINEWELTITVADGIYDNGTGTSSDFTATALFTFDDGQISGITSADCTVDGTSLSFDLAFADADPQTLTIAYEDVTQFADTTLDMAEFSQNGVPAGSFQNLSINDFGFVSLNYSNGVSRLYYQIPVATFISPENLERADGTAFKATTGSGTVNYSEAGSAGAGKIITNALEISTVDIAQEFTTMIQAQQAYSANAKTISTADEMLQKIINV